MLNFGITSLYGTRSPDTMAFMHRRLTKDSSHGRRTWGYRDIVLWLLLLSIVIYACSPVVSREDEDTSPLTPVHAKQPAYTPIPPIKAIDPTPKTTLTANPSPTQPTPAPILPHLAKYPPAIFHLQSTDLRIEGGITKIEVCFNTPDGDDWMIHAATFHTGGIDYPIEASSPGEIDFQSEDYPDGYRCETIEFILPGDEIPSTGTLTIHSLAESLQEGKSCSKFMQEVQPVLDRQGIQISFTCQEDHGYTIEITGWPSSLTRGQALSMIEQFYIIRGDWEFIW